ncbi:hypothetical protein AOL_s00088g55 [Orbilia oligospora ATCC 24927]|uniref:Uncharacterized protein n=1 Tax=Arthrobotrys oligospora (strain ATCC 24927 / CBS 115.81 / DSM 1491) TaxID=756982 RepID=G1XHU2_ARTOA|nr:hypothetical protein AOL_s00088g55 [Orbilia oligospora ATCC 24927]EGX47279.1 hypothetical protein AOL_s00088g55 [Orbilia oligospora ATCC 24927]
MAIAVNESLLSPYFPISSSEENTAPGVAAPRRRQGPRKPVYATQKESKIRSRAAQAARKVESSSGLRNQIQCSAAMAFGLLLPSDEI